MQVYSITHVEKLLETLSEQGTELGISLLKAIAIFVIGRYIIKLINKVVKGLLSKRHIDPAVSSFLGSLINIALIVMLIVSVIAALGIQTSSFAALIASAGVAIGMALSGNLSNFAGGIIILLFKPFKIGDYISTADVQGTVVDIQIFHTILTTFDNIKVYIPNGSLSSGYIKNMSTDKRRVDWTFGIDYGEDFERAKKAILDAVSGDSRILKEHEPFIELNELADSSVNIVLRLWVKSSDYWDIYFLVNKLVYAKFNSEGINFPFPQLTVHNGKE